MSTRALLLLAGLLGTVVLIGLATLVPPDGRERADLLQFLGNFHPLAVHLPIALLLLVPVLEIGGREPRRRQLRSAAGFVLGLAALSALATPYLGWLLAWSGGFEGKFVTQHMWGGIAVAGLTVLCWILRSSLHAGTDQLPASYVAMLTLNVMIVAFTGYRGGQLAHGENHLTEHLPPAFQAWLGDAPKDVPAGSFYAARVAPIFENHCLICHSANKHKGGLRLDSYAALMRGGENGMVIKAADAKASELIRRVNLDPAHREFMPAEGKPSLSAADRKVLELWVDAGASSTLAADAIAGAPLIQAPAEPLAPDYRPHQAAIASLASALNVRLVPRSRNPTDGLVLRTGSAPTECNDVVLAKLAPVARYIVDAELARTKVTDAGTETLKQFTHLRWLDLSYTAITPAGVRNLTKLDNLVALNLTGTDVDATSAEPLRKKKTLKHLYTFQIKATP